MKRITSTILLTMLVVVVANAQLLHFSQFYAQPLAINPAYGGDYKGDVRLAIINRRQWGQLGTPLDTKGASLEKKIRIVNNFLILGGQFLTDKTTAEGLETTMAHFSATFQKAYGKNLLALGVQAGLINRRLNEDQTFPSQFDPSTGLFDPGLNSGENFLVDGRGHPNVNVGILWTSIYRSKIRFKTGASFSHINFPDEAFSGTISRRPIRYLVHHSIEARISPQWTIAPEAQLIYSGGAKQLLTLMRVERKLNDVTAITGGFGFRGYAFQNDAAIGLISLSYHYTDIGFSYDFNINELSNETRKTAFEISLIARTPPKKYKKIMHKKNKPCPVYVDPF